MKAIYSIGNEDKMNKYSKIETKAENILVLLGYCSSDLTKTIL